MEVLNTIPLNGTLSRLGVGSTDMVMAATGVTYSKQLGSGAISLIMSTAGAGVAVRRAQASAFMVMNGQGEAPPIVRGQAGAIMRFVSAFTIPFPKIIQAGLLPFVRDRRMSVAAEKRILFTQPEPRRFIVQPDARSA